MIQWNLFNAVTLGTEVLWPDYIIQVAVLHQAVTSGFASFGYIMEF